MSLLDDVEMMVVEELGYALVPSSPGRRHAFLLLQSYPTIPLTLSSNLGADCNVISATTNGLFKIMWLRASKSKSN